MQYPELPQAPYFPPPPPPARPSAFYKVVGILQLVLGIAGILWTTVGLGMLALATSVAPGAMSMYDTPTTIYLYAQSGFGLVTGALLAVTGYAVFRGKRWARPIGVTYAGLSLASTLISTVVQIVVVQPKVYAHTAASTPGMSGIEQKMQLFSIVMAIGGALVVAVVPVFTLIVLLRRAAKDELDA